MHTGPHGQPQRRDYDEERYRDIVRACEDAVRECRNARHRLQALLLRTGIT